MTILPTQTEATPPLTLPEVAALLTDQTDSLHTAVSTALHDNLARQHGRLATPPQLSEAGQSTVASYLQSLHHDDPAPLKAQAEALAAQGLDHHAALALADVLYETSLSLLPPDLPQALVACLRQRHRHFLQQYMAGREQAAAHHAQVEARRLGYILEQSLDGTAIANLDGIVQFVNPAWATMHGYTPDELVGQHLSIFHTPQQLAQEVEPINRQAIAHGQPQRAEIGHVRRNGATFPTLMTIGLLKDDNGNPLGLVASAQDITERKAVEEALRANETRFRSLVDNIPGTVYRCALDEAYTMELLSEDILALSGYPATDFINNHKRTYASIIYKNDREIVDTYILDGVQKQTPYAIEYRIVHADGRLVWIGEWGQAIYGDNGEPLWLDGVLLDITSQKEAEETLAKRARELQAVAEVGTAVSTILDVDRLLQNVVDLAKERFKLYHAHLYLLDETKQNLVLTAGAGEVGKEMVAQSWQIPLQRESSLVARVARTREGAIVNDVQVEPDFLPNPLLPETRSELAVPIVVGENLLGVLDVQAVVTDHFSDEDITIQMALATQIGVAVQNARSYAASEAARRELDQLTRRLTRDGWEDYLAQQNLPQINVAVGQAPANGQAHNHPLVVQGERIGQLVLAEPQQFSQEAAEIITAVAERLGGHIENLRLSAQTEAALAQTEQQAERLALLNEMGTALSNATTLIEIYHIAAEYTARVLGSDRTSLALLNPSGDSVTLIELQGLSAGNVTGETLPLAGTAIARAIQEQRPLISPQDFDLPEMYGDGPLVTEGIKSFICAPLLAGERPLGALNVGSRKDKAYDRTDATLIQQVVSLLAATLESRRLFEQTRRRAEREALVNAISQKIQNASTIQSALQTAVAELGQALQVKRATVELAQTGPLPKR